MYVRSCTIIVYIIRTYFWYIGFCNGQQLDRSTDEVALPDSRGIARLHAKVFSLLEILERLHNLKWHWIWYKSDGSRFV